MDSSKQYGFSGAITQINNGGNIGLCRPSEKSKPSTGFYKETEISASPNVVTLFGGNCNHLYKMGEIGGGQAAEAGGFCISDAGALTFPITTTFDHDKNIFADVTTLYNVECNVLKILIEQENLKIVIPVDSDNNTTIGKGLAEDRGMNKLQLLSLQTTIDTLQNVKYHKTENKEPLHAVQKLRGFVKARMNLISKGGLKAYASILSQLQEANSYDELMRIITPQQSEQQPPEQISVPQEQDESKVYPQQQPEQQLEPKQQQSEQQPPEQQLEQQLEKRQLEKRQLEQQLEKQKQRQQQRQQRRQQLEQQQLEKQKRRQKLEQQQLEQKQLEQKQKRRQQLEKRQQKQKRRQQRRQQLEKQSSIQSEQQSEQQSSIQSEQQSEQHSLIQPEQQSEQHSLIQPEQESEQHSLIQPEQESEQHSLIQPEQQSEPHSLIQPEPQQPEPQQPEPQQPEPQPPKPQQPEPQQPEPQQPEPQQPEPQPPKPQQPEPQQPEPQPPKPQPPEQQQPPKQPPEQQQPPKQQPEQRPKQPPKPQPPEQQRPLIQSKPEPEQISVPQEQDKSKVSPKPQQRQQGRLIQPKQQPEQISVPQEQDKSKVSPKPQQRQQGRLIQPKQQPEQQRPLIQPKPEQPIQLKNDIILQTKTERFQKTRYAFDVFLFCLGLALITIGIIFNVTAVWSIGIGVAVLGIGGIGDKYINSNPYQNTIDNKEQSLLNIPSHQIQNNNKKEFSKIKAVPDNTNHFMKNEIDIDRW